MWENTLIATITIESLVTLKKKIQDQCRKTIEFLCTSNKQLKNGIKIPFTIASNA